MRLFSSLHGPVALLSVAVFLGFGCHDSTAPVSGSLEVSVLTTGAEIDPDGYTISIDGGVAQGIGVNAAVKIGNLTTGSHLVQLNGLTANCSVSGTNPRPVDVVAGQPSPVSVPFFVACVPNTGILQVTTLTTGMDIDPDEYGLNVHLENSASSTSVHLQRNGTTEVAGLRPGNYLLTFLSTPDCDPVIPNPRKASVQIGSVTTVHIDVSCAPPGQLAFVSSAEGSDEIYLVKSNGADESRIGRHPALDADPAWSPDGTKLAFTSRRDGNLDVYTMNADGTGTVRLTTDGAPDYRPAWSPDGSRIAFVSARDGNSEIYVISADGQNPLRLTNNDALDSEPSWSPGGTRIVFRSDRDSTPKIYFMSSDGSGVTRVTTNDYSFETEPAWSPDGTRIAFSQGRPGGTRDIVVVNVDRSGVARVAQELNDAADPAWSPDGRKIAFSVVMCRVFYCDDPERALLIARADGGGYTIIPSVAAASNPTWRPR